MIELGCTRSTSEERRATLIRLRTRILALAAVSTTLVVASAVAAVAAPASPSSLTANLGAGGVVLSWQDDSTDETLFTVESCQGAVCEDFRQIATVGADSTSYLDPTSDAGVNRYRVAAINASGTSAFSNVAEIILLGTEEPVASFTATPQSGTAPLGVTFDGRTSTAFGGGAVDSYTWSFGDGSTAIEPVVNHTFTNPGSYTVILTVKSGFSTDAVSTVVTVTLGLVPPQNLVAVAPARGRVDLTWSNPPSTTSSLTVQRCSGMNCTSFSPIATVAPSTSAYTDTSVKRKKAYTYRLLATDQSGSVISNTAAVVTR